jgi:hypothetical protein
MCHIPNLECPSHVTAARLVDNPTYHNHHRYPPNTNPHLPFHCLPTLPTMVLTRSSKIRAASSSSHPRPSAAHSTSPSPILKSRSSNHKKRQSKLTPATSTNPIQPALPKGLVKRIPGPITQFNIPFTTAGLTGTQDIIHHLPSICTFSHAIQREYTNPFTNQKFIRSRIEVRKRQLLLGYVPIPTRYSYSWKQLIYNIKMYMSLYSAFRIKLNQIRADPVLQHDPDSCLTNMELLANNITCSLLNCFHARRLILQELLNHIPSPDGHDQLPLFDEWLLRQATSTDFTTSYQDIPKHHQPLFALDPVHPKNAPWMCKFHPISAPSPALSSLSSSWSSV